SVLAPDDFPVTPDSVQPFFGGGQLDAFVTKINAAGSHFVYSTYLGGTSDDRGHGIAVDAAGNAYVTGETTSSGFTGVTGASLHPSTSGGTDAFVTKLNAGGTATVYSTFLGGGASDQGFGIALDGAANAYVVGTTYGGFPVTAGSIPTGSLPAAFVTK